MKVLNFNHNTCNIIVVFQELKSTYIYYKQFILHPSQIKTQSRNAIVRNLHTLWTKQSQSLAERKADCFVKNKEYLFKKCYGLYHVLAITK